MSLKRGQLLLLVIIVTSGLFVGCPPTTVIIKDKDGNIKEVPVSEAAKLAFDAAKKDHSDGKKEAAAKKLEDFLRDYPDADQIDNALMILGQLNYESGQFESAADYFRQLIADHPASPYYVKSAVQLGLSLVKAGRTAEALPTLQSVFDRLPNEKKKAEVAGMLAESYMRAGAPSEALLWFTKLYERTTVKGARLAIRLQVLGLIDQQLSFVQVRQLLEGLKSSGAKGFPLDLLQFKLAKIFYHMLDFERSRENLELFVATFPDHELAGQAGKLLKRIIDRNRVSPNTIGVLLPLTGEYREYGRRALEGIQLGAGIFNESKGSESSSGPILVIRDTGGDPDKAVKQLEDLVYNEHVVAVIGPMVAKEAYAASVKAEELEIPIVTLSIRKDITSLGQYTFRNFLTLASQAKTLVAHAMERLGAKRFAILYPNDWYGVEFANAFWDEVDRHKGEVRAVERYEPDEKNFAKHIKKMVGRYFLQARWEYTRERAKIRAKIKTPLGRKRAFEKLIKSLRPVIDFDVLFVPDYVDKVVMIAPALAFEDIILNTDSRWHLDRIKKSLGRTNLDMIYLLGGNGWNNPKVIEWAKRYVQGAIFCDGFFLQSSRPATRLFVGKFKANFERDPSMVEAHAYDTAMIFNHIFLKHHPRDRRAFRSQLLGLKKFEGATGDISFSASGEVEKEIFLLTIKKEAIEEILTGPATDAGSG
ncbi:MAG: penicillin-binding protein activator [Deltaproteobacteria bacterium]|nr:penicillin-binding protein activator [Deltaproteobacteria bacterium]